MLFKNVPSIHNLNDTVAQEQAVLVYFSHHNCNVCNVLRPKVGHMMENHFPQVVLYYVDILHLSEAKSQYAVFAVPTLLVFFDGKEYIREGRYVNLEKFHERLSKLYNLYFG
jgi:thioredoxin-like negative regulator of GroEL